jgi:tripartite-type tricarboxylate transporter receptor subunit TctC
VKMSHLFLALFAWTLAAGGAQSQEQWPSRPIKLIVPFAAGGNTDVVSRIAAQFLQQRLGVSVFVENRAGAGGITGTEAAARAKPDGYTFCICGNGPITVVGAIEKLPYEPLKDLTPISLVNTNALILLVHPSVRASTVSELIAMAKTRPGELNYGSPGVGGLIYFSAELFQSMTATKFTHVSYRGGALATQAVVSGEVQLLFANMSDALPQMEAKNVRPLAVTTTRRSSHAPDVPTMAEAGLAGYNVESWNGMFAPAGTPSGVIEHMAKLLAEFSQDPASVERIRRVGSEPAANAPADYESLIRTETALWNDVVKGLDLKRK